MLQPGLIQTSCRQPIVADSRGSIGLVAVSDYRGSGDVQELTEAAFSVVDSSESTSTSSNESIPIG